MKNFENLNFDGHIIFMNSGINIYLQLEEFSKIASNT